MSAVAVHCTSLLCHILPPSNSDGSHSLSPLPGSSFSFSPTPLLGCNPQNPTLTNLRRENDIKRCSGGSQNYWEGSREQSLWPCCQNHIPDHSRPGAVQTSRSSTPSSICGYLLCQVCCPSNSLLLHQLIPTENIPFISHSSCVTRSQFSLSYMYMNVAAL